MIATYREERHLLPEERLWKAVLWRAFDDCTYAGYERTLIVAKNADEKLVLSARNMPHIKIIEADMLNVYDVLLYPQLVMLETAAQDVQERLK